MRTRVRHTARTLAARQPELSAHARDPMAGGADGAHDGAGIDTTVAARFRVGAVLGKGAYGTVWRAECRLTGAPAPSPAPGRSKSQLAADALTCSLARALGGARLEASQSH